MIPFARIASLIPSLGRENDNEVIATARAISVALATAGHDLYDLADVVRSHEAQAGSAAPSSAAWAPSHRAWQAKTDRDRATWLAMYGASSLTEWEIGFVDSLVSQFGRRGASPKQSARLGQIFDRVSRAAA